ncbi:MAG: STT3 domain-containing protein [archaeon]
MEESELIQERKKKAIKFFKDNYNVVSYVVLAIVVWIAVKIRTSNLGGLKDITTGTWTLGPDLDPFLFLRWAKYIVENGSLMANDVMRYVPLGFDTSKELVLHSYLIAWFHKIAVIFGSESVTHSAVLYPAFMFALAMIAFFFMTRLIFSRSFDKKFASAVALIATFFLSVIPAILPRTIAGIPEKEASGLAFLFLSFYLYLASWNSEKNLNKYLLAGLAGLATAGMALVWGGYIYVTISITLATLIAFFLGKVDKKRTISYSLWILVFILVFLGMSNRTGLSNLVASTSVGPSIFLFFVLVVDQLVFGTKLKEKVADYGFFKIPRPVASFVMSLVIGVVLFSIFFGPSTIFSKIGDLKNQLVSPSSDRLGVTVAENRQPYFSEWESNFGPHVRGVALTFWLFFIGSVHLFYLAVLKIGKSRVKFTIAYVAVLVSLVFSRYSSAGTLNGTNFASLVFYALGPLILLFVLGHHLWNCKSEESKEKLREIDFNLVFLLAFFVISLLSARSAVRLIMMLVPSASIIVAYIAVVLPVHSLRIKDSLRRNVFVVISAIVVIAVLFAGYAFYQGISAGAPNNVPSSYTQQWQKAMSWVRENTSEDAVFGHWWDYGYWVQTIGERATVLDGGNARPYWNHLMGRYALTGPNERDALDFLYAHNTTHFLIDSTDIGKYSAFSSIGSDASYDRASYIPSFLRDNSQTQEKKNSTVFVYSGGAGLDGDIVYEENGSRIFLPSGKAGLGAILVEMGPGNKIISNPRGIFVYEGRQYNIPFRYAYDDELKDFGFGLNASIFLMPKADQNSGGGVTIEQQGALLYLSERVAHSQLAKLYLYKQEPEGFVLAHSEDDFVVASMKSQGVPVSNDLVYFGGVRGPIRIWEIDYPSDIEYKQEFVDTYYPEELIRT